MKKAAEYLGFGIVGLLMVVAAFTYLAPHFGWRVDAVLSGSMEPELKIGSIVVVRPVQPETVAVGDIITFFPPGVDETMITHRVVGVEQASPLYFKTKGDANGDPDSFTVPARNLVGRVCFHAPYWGYATEFLKTPLGFLFAVVIPGSILITMYIISMWQAITKDGKTRPDKVMSDE